MNPTEHYTAGMNALRKAETLASQQVADLNEQASRVCALAAVATAHFAAASVCAHTTGPEREATDA